MSDQEGGTAFPVVHPDGKGVQYFGMTLRDYFAANATDGDVSDVRHTYYMNNGHKLDFAALTQAQARYMHADAMLTARGESK